ncbi:MAG: NAD(P)H-binding protein [Janthinobacterium lividum]
MFGSSGPVGRAVVAQVLDAGHGVIAVTPRPENFGMEAPRLRVGRGDVADPSEVEAALEGADAVVSANGVKLSRSRSAPTRLEPGTCSRRYGHGACAGS